MALVQDNRIFRNAMNQKHRVDICGVVQTTMKSIFVLTLIVGKPSMALVAMTGQIIILIGNFGDKPTAKTHLVM